MYKHAPFHLSPLAHIEEDLQEAGGHPHLGRRVYLVGGNAFVLGYDKLAEIADLIRHYIPHNEGIAMNARVDDIGRKSLAELMDLRAKGIDRLYIGSESGDDDVLKAVNKGYAAAEIVTQGRKLEAANIGYMLSYLSGLAGHGQGEKNAIASAQIYNQLRPTAIGASTLTLFPDTDLYQAAQAGTFVPSTELAVLEELRTFVAPLETSTYFWAAHTTIATPIAGHLPDDKDRLLAMFDRSIADFDESQALRRRQAVRTL